MQHATRNYIRVLNVITQNNYDQYELEISTAEETYTYYMRFSELRKMFKKFESVRV